MVLYILMVTFTESSTNTLSFLHSEPTKTRVIKTIIEELDQHGRVTSSKVQSVEKKPII